MSKNNETETLAIGIRLEHSLVHRLDAVAARLSQEPPDPRSWGRSDAIRAAIRHWVEARESQFGITPSTSTAKAEHTRTSRAKDAKPKRAPKATAKGK